MGHSQEPGMLQGVRSPAGTNTSETSCVVIQRATRISLSDYVVIGTGSSGAVVANRLSADTATHVVVLEAGPADKDKYIRIPCRVCQALPQCGRLGLSDRTPRAAEWPRNLLAARKDGRRFVVDECDDVDPRVRRRLRRVGRARWKPIGHSAR